MTSRVHKLDITVFPFSARPQKCLEAGKTVPVSIRTPTKYRVVTFKVRVEQIFGPGKLLDRSATENFSRTRINRFAACSPKRIKRPRK